MIDITTVYILPIARSTIPATAERLTNIQKSAIVIIATITIGGIIYAISRLHTKKIQD